MYNRRMKSISLLIKPFSSGCNMRCKYCFYANVSSIREVRNFGKMQPQIVDELIKKVFDVCPESISFAFQGGEPTLVGVDFFEDFVARVNAYNSRRVQVHYALQTNGLMIDDAFAMFLAKYKFLVGLSLDGNKDITDLNRLDAQGKSVFLRVMRCADILRRHGVDFNILSVVTNISARKGAQTYNFFKKHSFDYLQFIACIDDFGEETELSAERYGKFLIDVFDVWYEDFIHGKYVSIRAFDNYVNILRGMPPENCAMSGRCGLYYVVESDGSLYPCDFYCLDDRRLGSVLDDHPFEENDVHSRFVNESLNVSDKCRACKYFALCRGGCRRDREPSLTTNKYCSSYYTFFEHAANKLATIAKMQG